MTKETRYEVIDDIFVSINNNQEQEEYRMKPEDDCMLIVRGGEVYLQYQKEEYLTNNTQAHIILYLENAAIKRI